MLQVRLITKTRDGLRFSKKKQAHKPASSREIARTHALIGLSGCSWLGYDATAKILAAAVWVESASNKRRTTSSSTVHTVAPPWRLMCFADIFNKKIQRELFLTQPPVTFLISLLAINPPSSSHRHVSAAVANARSTL
ncbi:hypothetical protein PHBOTO_000644 [Pseudozyma hubeiensis]|nr:hypothetical protein PHBOTO_000644 [Pseudozyma hubeiensis]